MDTWKEAKTAEGKVYYYNSLTKETSWTLPGSSKPRFDVDAKISAYVSLRYCLICVYRALAVEEELTRQLEATLNILRGNSNNHLVAKVCLFVVI